MLIRRIFEVVFLSVCMIFSAVLSASELNRYDLKLRGDGDAFVLHFDSKPGVISDVSLDATGSRLALVFNELTEETLLELIKSIEVLPESIESIRVVNTEKGKSAILINTQFPVILVDQDLFALESGLTRWVLSYDRAPVTENAPLEGALSYVDFMDSYTDQGKFGLVLGGSKNLTASLKFDGREITLEFEKVETDSLVRAVSLFEKTNDEKVISSVALLDSDEDAARVVVSIQPGYDLVDSQGSVLEERGQIVLTFAKDVQPEVVAFYEVPALKIEEIHSSLAFFQYRGDTLDNVNVYALNNPNRIMMDFLGKSPEQVYAILQESSLSHPSLLGVRYGQTRLGSGRIEFELKPNVKLINKRLVDLGPFAQERVLFLAQLQSDLPKDSTTQPFSLSYEPSQDFYEAPNRSVLPSTVDVNDEALLKPYTENRHNFSLLEFYQQALKNDNDFLIAKADYLKSLESIPQARSELLPSLSLNGQISHIYKDAKKVSSPFLATGSEDFERTSLNLSLTQPLMPFASLTKLDQAELSVSQAKVNLMAAEQSLRLKVATLYLNLLANSDALDLAKAERMAVESQFEQVKTRFNSGLATKVQFDEISSRLALTQANEIEAENNLQDARLAMKETVNVSVEGVRGFHSDFDAVPPQPDVLTPWLEKAKQQNLALLSRQIAKDIAKLEIRKQSQGHLPSLDLIGGASSDTQSATDNQESSRTDELTVALKLSLPLYQGGLTSSLVREAAASLERAQRELDQEVRVTERLTHSSFNAVNASAQKLSALRKTVAAQGLALNAKRSGFASGLNSLTEMLDAYRLYYSAKRDYLQSRYDYLVNRLKLKQSIGSLSRQDLMELDYLLN